MYYTIYVVYNVINGKEYVGKHKTRNINDKYMGSGKLVQRAIKKYGKENFIKDILFVFDSEQKVNAKEKELVTQEYINSKISYNLCPGGYGGFGYINENNLADHISSGRKGGLIINQKMQDKNYRTSYIKKLSNKAKLNHKLGLYVYNSKNLWRNGKKHTQKTKTQMSFSHKGSKNSQFGTCWITNGSENKKIKKEELALYINQGYYKGRIK